MGPVDDDVVEQYLPGHASTLDSEAAPRISRADLHDPDPCIAAK
jgi:hypothetical protein